MVDREPFPIRAASLAALVALLLTACGSPAVPTEAALALTSASPDVALPGASVTLTGTGFDEDRVVTFDGLPATVLDATDTTLTVVVPEAYGYPTIAVDDAIAEGLVFVGTAYAGAADLDAVQAALDALPPGAALRLPEGTYGAPGTGLDVDDRRLYGSGSATVLDLDDATGLLRVFARLPHGAVLADLSVADGFVYVGQGRLATSAVDGAVPLASARFDGVELDVAAFRTLGTLYGVSIEVVDSSVTATDAVFQIVAGALEIVEASLVIDTNLVAITEGSAVDVRATTLDTAAIVVQAQTPSAAARFADVVLTASGPIQLIADGAIALEGAALDAAGIVVQSAGDLTMHGSDLGSSAEISLQTDASATVTDTTLVGATAVVVIATTGLRLNDAVLTASTNEVVLQAGAGAVVEASALTGTSGVAVVGSAGGLVFEGTDVVATAGSVNLFGDGPVVATGGTWAATANIILTTQTSAGVALRAADSVTAGSTLVLSDSAGVVLAGRGGTLTFEDNGATDVGGFAVSGGASDVVVRGNAPIVAGSIVISTTAAHVDLHDNARLESATDVVVAVLGAGARLNATGNAFVADEVAGLVRLETEPGALTVADNTYVAATVDLIGE